MQRESPRTLHSARSAYSTSWTRSNFLPSKNDKSPLPRISCILTDSQRMSFPSSHHQTYSNQPIILSYCSTTKGYLNMYLLSIYPIVPSAHQITISMSWPPSLCCKTHSATPAIIDFLSYSLAPLFPLPPLRLWFGKFTFLFLLSFILGRVASVAYLSSYLPCPPPSSGSGDLSFAFLFFLLSFFGIGLRVPDFLVLDVGAQVPKGQGGTWVWYGMKEGRTWCWGVEHVTGGSPVDVNGMRYYYWLWIGVFGSMSEEREGDVMFDECRRGYSSYGGREKQDWALKIMLNGGNASAGNIIHSYP